MIRLESPTAHRRASSCARKPGPRCTETGATPRMSRGRDWFVRSELKTVDRRSRPAVDPRACRGQALHRTNQADSIRIGRPGPAPSGCAARHLAAVERGSRRRPARRRGGRAPGGGRRRAPDSPGRPAARSRCGRSGARRRARGPGAMVQTAVRQRGMRRLRTRSAAPLIASRQPVRPASGRRPSMPSVRCSRSATAARISSATGAIQRSFSSTARVPPGARTTHCGRSTCGGTSTGASVQATARAIVRGSAGASGRQRLPAGVWKCATGAVEQPAAEQRRSGDGGRRSPRQRAPADSARTVRKRLTGGSSGCLRRAAPAPRDRSGSAGLPRSSDSGCCWTQSPSTRSACAARCSPAACGRPRAGSASRRSATLRRAPSTVPCSAPSAVCAEPSVCRTSPSARLGFGRQLADRRRRRGRACAAARRRRRRPP